MSTKDPDKLNEEPLTVFISYASPDVAIAEKVEAFLTAASIGVFRDNQIASGQNWDLEIEKALERCGRMVLLLSASSMPFREEVHREWFRFLKKGKIVHPLLIEDCTLHSRFDSLNYIDARKDLAGALNRLKNDLTGRTGETQSIIAVDDALPDALQDLYDLVCGSAGEVVLSVDQALAIKDHQPADVREYRLGRIAEWSLPRYQLDKRFVNLTLSMDQGEDNPQRWQKVEDFRSKDLREVLEKRKDDRVLVLLGKPGSGKSTLLRRLQLDHIIDQLRQETDWISFFIQLNEYDVSMDPREWLLQSWANYYPDLPPLETWLKKGRALLLLDALNEMPHASIEDYNRLAIRWRGFAQQVTRAGNRMLFSCRSLDYGGRLSVKGFTVPQVFVQPMDEPQVREFIRSYTPEHEERLWSRIKDPGQFELYQTPYFLDLLCNVVGATGEIPAGRTGLFTYFVRMMLGREKNERLFQPDSLLSELDWNMVDNGHWPGPFDLPEDGLLIPKLSELAFRMQEKGRGPEVSLVRIGHAEACGIVNHDRARDILKASVSLNVIDIDTGKKEQVAYFHQLLQEYFAARRLAKTPNPALVHVEWAVDKVSESLEAKLAKLADGDPLPPLPQTGWEETTVTAAPMAEDHDAFIRDLIPHNLPLAARCAASPEVSVDEELKREIREKLVARTQDMKCDLRARIAAGEALGLIGDPRFEIREGNYGKYLLPPLVEIPGGTYPIGDDESTYDFEKPAHQVTLEPFQIGRFPVTNAEYAMFMAAGGYEDERWWDTEESLAWLKGEGSNEGSKQQLRENKRLFESWSEEDILNLVTQNKATSEQAEIFIAIRNMTGEQFESMMEEIYPAGKTYRQPGFWDDTRFNNPNQPVVGVTWFEARAYCNWLTATIAGEKIFRLPTEVEYEAVARGKKGRLFAYGDEFDATRGNTFESHIRRSTPVGIFNNATPEGAFDLSGNVWSWTLSIYDQERFPYPYKNDERENVDETGVRRVLRGGS